MQILAIDYGRKKIGLALANTSIAEPLTVIRFKSKDEAFEKIQKVVSLLTKSWQGRGGKRLDLIVMGVSEGEMAKETKEFGKELQERLGLPVVFQDETLTTQEAQFLSRKAGIRRRKRKAMEDAFSAALILQSFLDSCVNS